MSLFSFHLLIDIEKLLFLFAKKRLKNFRLHYLKWKKNHSNMFTLRGEFFDVIFLSISIDNFQFSLKI